MPRFTDIQKKPDPPKNDRQETKFDAWRAAETTHEFREAPHRKLPWILIAAIVIFVGVYGLRLLDIKKLITDSTAGIKNQFKDVSGLIQNLEVGKAGALLSSTVEDIDNLNAEIQSENVLKFSFQSIPSAIKSLAELGKSILMFGRNLEELTANSFRWMVRGEGPELIRTTRALKDTLSEIENSAEDFQERAAELGYDIGNEYEKISAQLFRSGQFLNAFLSWLETERQHFLIFFQNTSEIRPGGGFVGSYADLEIKNGSIVNIDVRNIYDPDGQMETKIIPPKPLQLITYSWGARDANWFFDFPTSARKITALLEMSKMYKEKDIVFSGALAINVGVIADMIGVTGPINLPEYGFSLTKENFLDTIQKEVRSGKDREGGEAKRVIKILTPVLLERISQLPEDKKAALLKVLQSGFAKKDLMLYFKDLAIESYFKDFGITGDVFEASKGESGDYLAVVNANIGGGKTDAVISQNIKISSVLYSDGSAANRLLIRRTHRGDKEQDWWYKLTDKNFMQIFTPFGAILKKSSGLATQKIPDPVDYRARGYTIDPDVRAVETSDSVFGKTVFSGWLNVAPGETEQAILEYEIQNAAQVKDGAIYKFVFEKQSGAATDFEATIQAPLGYRWRNNQSKIFGYYSADPPGRVILNLILEKDND